MARVVLVSPWSSIWKVNRVPGMWHKCDASFSEGFAQVRKDFKYGYIDKSDKLVIEIEPGTLKFPDWQSVMKYLQSK